MSLLRHKWLYLAATGLLIPATLQAQEEPKEVKEVKVVVESDDDSAKSEGKPKVAQFKVIQIESDDPKAPQAAAIAVIQQDDKPAPQKIVAPAVVKLQAVEGDKPQQLQLKVVAQAAVETSKDDEGADQPKPEVKKVLQLKQLQAGDKPHIIVVQADGKVIKQGAPQVKVLKAIKFDDKPAAPADEATPDSEGKQLRIHAVPHKKDAHEAQAQIIINGKAITLPKAPEAAPKQIQIRIQQDGTDAGEPQIIKVEVIDADDVKAEKHPRVLMLQKGTVPQAAIKLQAVEGVKGKLKAAAEGDAQAKVKAEVAHALKLQAVPVEVREKLTKEVQAKVAEAQKRIEQAHVKQAQAIAIHKAKAAEVKSQVEKHQAAIKHHLEAVKKTHQAETKQLVNQIEMLKKQIAEMQARLEKLENQ